MKGNFLTLYTRMFYKPRSTFGLIFNSGNSLKYGLLAMLVPALGYTLFYTMAFFAGGSPSVFKPWLAIPIEKYFGYDIFLTLPGYYLSWIGASATVYLISRSRKGHGNFDNVLSIVGFGIGVATWSSLLHDLVDALLSITGVIEMAEYEALLNEPTIWRGLLFTLYMVYFIWITTLFSIGIKTAQGFGWIRSVAIAITGLIAYQLILLIFIR